MEIKIKRLHPNAVIPRYATQGDAGLDLTAVTSAFDDEGNIVYGTGLAIEIPKGYVGLVFPRSSICKKRLALTNSVGVIDSGYRGEIMAKFKPTNSFRFTNYGVYEVGERIAQLMIVPYPIVEFVEVEHLSASERGEGGYGHTGL